MNHRYRPLDNAFIPEERLLIHCSHVQLRLEDKTHAVALLQGPLDWRYLLEVSIRHGLSPLFYHGLQQLSQDVDTARLVPAHAQDELRALYHGTQARNHRLYRTVGEVVKACDRVGAPTMGLKDLQLTREVFPDMGLRPMGDLDLLIHQNDYHKVSQCLHELGFSPVPHDDVPFMLKYSFGHQFRRPTDNIWIDLQWNIMQREWDVYREGSFSFDTSRLWSRAVSLAIDDYRLLVPSPEEMLFHLCLHLEGHQYCEFILFCDIAEFLRHYEGRLDWNFFIQLTKEYQAESSVYYVLLLTQRLLGATLPSSLLQELDPLYYKANLFGPLFGNLTDLHVSLDDIRRASAPPNRVMQNFEIAARAQAASAMQGFKEIDALATAFVAAGGTDIMLTGDAPAKIFPDPALRPFETISFGIVENDLPRMHQALYARGFHARPSSDPDLYHKEWEFVSTDPVLANRPLALRAQIKIERDIATVVQTLDAKKEAKKETAWKALRAKLRRNEATSPLIPLEIRLLVLSPEMLFLWLSIRLATHQQDRLFHICNLLEFFRRHRQPLHWQSLATLAQRFNASHAVAEAVSIVSAFLPEEECPSSALSLFGRSDTAPRILEWARYGPDAFVRHTDLKNAFYYLFSLLSIEGMKERGKYVLASLLGQSGKKSVFSTLLRDVTTSVLSSTHKKPLTTRDFAYWIEPGAGADVSPPANLIL